MMEYVARFIELAHFGDDYVATDMANVRRFENGLKLSIQGKIVGLRLQDMDSMVGTTLTIEREIEDARGIRAAGTSEKREDQPSSSSRKRQKTSTALVSQGGPGQQRQGQTKASNQAGQVTCFHCQKPEHMRPDCPHRQGSQGFQTV